MTTKTTPQELFSKPLEQQTQEWVDAIYGQRFDETWLTDACRDRIQIYLDEILRLHNVLTETAEYWEKAWADRDIQISEIRK